MKYYVILFLILLPFSITLTRVNGQVSFAKFKKDTTLQIDKREVKLKQDNYYLSVGKGVIISGKDTVMIDNSFYSLISITDLSDKLSKKDAINKRIEDLNNENQDLEQAKFMLWLLIASLTLIVIILIRNKVIEFIQKMWLRISKKNNKNESQVTVKNDTLLEEDLSKKYKLLESKFIEQSTNLMNLNETIKIKEVELSELKLNTFYSFDAYNQFIEPAEACIYEIERAEKLVIDTFKKSSLHYRENEDNVLISQILTSHILRVGYDKIINKWDQNIRILKNRKGAIFDLELSNILKNYTNTDSRLAELKKNFCVEALLTRCNSTLIMLEELRAISMVSGSKSIVSRDFSNSIDQILNVTNQTFNIEIFYIKINEHYSASSNVSSINAPLNIYLNPINEIAKPGNILQILSYGAKIKGVELHNKYQKTEVVIK